jgi:hypothetical protein
MFQAGEDIMKLLLAVGVLSLISFTCFVQAEPKREVLFEATLDMDADGKLDRAVLVLVGPGRDKTKDNWHDIYPLSEGETVDLAIYMGGGTGPLDLAKPPAILKQNFIDREYAGWVQSLEVVNKRSLKVGWNYQPGSTNDLDEKLTIAWRKGKFLVVGLDVYWENHGENGNCQLNLSTGQGAKAEGEFPAPKSTFKARVKPVPLETWSKNTWPTQCDQQEK